MARLLCVMNCMQSSHFRLWHGKIFTLFAIATATTTTVIVVTCQKNAYDHKWMKQRMEMKMLKFENLWEWQNGMSEAPIRKRKTFTSVQFSFNKSLRQNTAIKTTTNNNNKYLATWNHGNIVENIFTIVAFVWKNELVNYVIYYILL